MDNIIPPDSIKDIKDQVIHILTDKHKYLNLSNMAISNAIRLVLGTIRYCVEEENHNLYWSMFNVLYYFKQKPLEFVGDCLCDLIPLSYSELAKKSFDCD